MTLRGHRSCPINNMGEWARAVWLEGDVEEEGTIPSCWITDDFVFWPFGINVLRAMSEMQQPTEKWKAFKLMQVKITSKDRTLCEDYNFTSAELSNDECDEEITQTQSKKSSREKCRTPSPPPALRTQFSSKKGRLSSSSSKSSVSKPRSRSRSPCKRSRSNSSDSSTSLQSYTSPQAQKQSCRSNEFSECILDSNQKSHQGKQRSKYCVKDIHSSGDYMATESLTPKVKRGSIGSDIFPMPEGRFQKRVLFLLTDIKENIKLVARKYENSDSDCYLDQITEPQQLQELEKELSSSSDAKTEMISRVSKIGGISLKDNVSKIMNRLMSNELMSGMNLKGNGGKIAFSKTELYNIIITCVLKNHKGTEHDVGQAIASCLKYAPDRKGGKRQKPQGENKED